MRQAGRTDPAYVKLRNKCGLPLHELFRHPDLAAEISLLPKRLGVDAIIMFQDILTPLSPMGAHFEFHPGPVLDKPLKTISDFESLRDYDVAEHLGFVRETLGRLRESVGHELPILGFAGAPLTLAMFLVEGQSPSRSTNRVQQLITQHPEALHGLLAKLAKMTVRYLDFQIRSGADAVQLFESFADRLTPLEYSEFAHPYHVRIFEELGDDVPRILFAKEQPNLHLMSQCGAEVISIGKCIDLALAKESCGKPVALQGNIDNELLLHGPLEEIERSVRRCIEAGGRTGHILNLNHGLLPGTPFEHVQFLVDVCKQAS
jgi:uroporphyrinogen decarboxylase